MFFSIAAGSSLSIEPRVGRATLGLSWTGALGPNTVWQVYANRRLAWHGTSPFCELPWPAASTRYEVAAIEAAYAATDNAQGLPAAPPLGRVALAWHGGPYLSAGAHNVAAFHIYGEPSPGAGLNQAEPVAVVPAQPGPLPADGFGRGRFGRGAFGHAELAYSWISPPMTDSGTWRFAITAVSSQGAESAVATVAVPVAVPPRAPAPNAAGQRLTYSLNPATGQATLNWNPPS